MNSRPRLAVCCEPFPSHPVSTLVVTLGMPRDTASEILLYRPHRLLSILVWRRKTEIGFLSNVTLATPNQVDARPWNQTKDKWRHFAVGVPRSPLSPPTMSVAEPAERYAAHPNLTSVCQR